ncbi:Abi/CAAX domain protein (plasmid) [Haloferax gibbonsii]|uniref:Abi/CAAX domain protein n=1 Tax=Haloferax gibbonsii TaxID=35746 RepID=A0A871BK25_HALGI|nr:Abi/CAAX domain protein [Haloferax gibbonsii]
MGPYIREYLRRLRLLSWNEREQRLRTLLRVYVFMTVYAIVSVSLPILIDPPGDGLFHSAVLRVLLVCCTIGLLIGAAIYLDKRPLEEYGLEPNRGWIFDLFAGLVIGGTIPTGSVLLGVAGGWITVGGTGYTLTAIFLRDVSLAVVIITGIAVVEELVFRGYVLTNAVEGMDLQWVSETTTIATAWSVSALLFAIAHPAPTLVAGLHFLSAGLLLGFAYLVSGQLGLPIGIHAGFNFVSGYVFPIASGSSVTIIALSVGGPAWLTGQTGLIQTGLQVLAALLIMGWVWFQTGHLGISPTIKSKLK